MEIKDITFSYDKKNDQLKSVTGHIEPGKITTIIGPNGCGKSTLLGVMSQNYTPRNGEVILDGKAISLYKPKELAKKLAVVHQHNDAPSDMTVEKLTGFGRMPHKSMFSQSNEEDEQAIEWALNCTNLQSKRKLTIDQLSGGERQRVWIAMALAQKTGILFLDEPTTYLDIYYQIELLELIKQLNAKYGLTIVMVLHDINQAIRYSDHLIVMKQGEIAMKGAPHEVITESTVKLIYGVDVVVKSGEDTGLYMVPVGI
ncbi:ABC transporter ATP-binding protein [Paenibacillus doosanensis]|uniref:Siderophore transport system ATP-binding protein YusV n=1 Tax=Paenibacillus konkukensis TaxID=2020716 RepID=A0ABY4RST8_9BACL|nr:MULTISPECIES: ABC transporter ATP-binding protein [Paenibacillus]MCS7464736.1 ABC transporter ATP-binding protein [Paenibacillus doosanensis]UQZ85030.1 putative siderophore transport system ATP-binding protein YusV [Paenibacillus konkukensis]